jgi:hypothetical protein
MKNSYIARLLFALYALGALTFIIGAVTKLEHWPLAGFLLLGGSLILAITTIFLLLLYIIYFRKIKREITREGAIIRTCFFGISLSTLATVFTLQHNPSAKLVLGIALACTAIACILTIVDTIKARYNWPKKLIWLLLICVFNVFVVPLYLFLKHNSNRNFTLPEDFGENQ